MNNFQHIYRKVISQLESKLPSWLKYHSPEHTKYVLEKVIYIAGKENISGHELFLLKIAALYHDSGFMISQKNHEDISCRIAAEELQEFKIKPEDIDKICGMITATEIPQNPKTKLENILADADLEYLGTDRFMEFGQNLYEELLHWQPNLSKEEWNQIQVKFITNHNFHTNFCKLYREPKKQENLEMIRKKLQKSG